MLRSFILVTIGSLSFMFTTSCSSDKAPSRKNTRQASGNQTDTQTSKKRPATPPEVVNNSGLGTEPCVSGAALQGASSFDTANVVFLQKCVLCHLSADTPGGDFNSPAVLKANADKIKTRINLAADDPNLMPPGEKLSAGQIGAIDAWIEAGSPLPPDADPNDLAMPGPSSDPCDVAVEPRDDGTGTDTATDLTAWNQSIEEAFKQFIEPEAKEACHDKGKPFFRKRDPENPAGICYDDASYPAPYACTYDGVLEAFNKSAVVKQKLDEYKANNWYFDDCGVYKGKPIVFFACYTNGDQTCLKLDALATDRLVILGEMIQAAP